MRPVDSNVWVRTVVERGPRLGNNGSAQRAPAAGQPGGPGNNGVLLDNQPGSLLNGVRPQGSDDAAGEQATAVWATTAEPTTGGPGAGGGWHPDSDWTKAHKRPGTQGANGEHSSAGGTVDLRCRIAAGGGSGG